MELTNSKTYKDFVNDTTALYTPNSSVVRKPEQKFNPVVFGSDNDGEQETIIHPNKAAAMKALQMDRINQRGNLTRKKTGGKKNEKNRSHVAYAWSPVVRKVYGEFICKSLKPVLYVYHATKGWKISHGVFADNPL